MNNLIFSLNATLPIFLLMMIGYIFKKTSVIDDRFASSMNRFVFHVALPVNLFVQLHDVNFIEVWDSSYVIYCFVATLLSVLIGALASCLIKNRSVRGEFIQASYRSSASLLGMAYIENIYGEATIGPLMMLGCVPLYNVCAVIVLSLTGSDSKGIDRRKLRSAILDICRNPIILGIFIGFLWSLTGIQMPAFAETTLSYIGRLASPMGLLAMGALLNFSSISKEIAPVISASFLKLIGFVTLLLPIAVQMGFRDEKLIAVLIMLGSASTVAGYTMAKNMGHDGTVSSGTVVVTTVLSSFTLTFWLWLLRSLRYI